MDISFIENNISFKRFESYTDEREYIDNIKLSGEIYGLLSIFEVALRNRVFAYFKERYSNCDDIFAKILEDFNDNNRISHSTRIINDGSLTVDQKISRLNLGFWVSLFSYFDEQNNIARYNYIPINKVFSNNINFQSLGRMCNISTNINVYQHQYNLEARYISMKLFQTIRNRSFHCENILKINNNNFPRISHKIYFVSTQNNNTSIIGIKGDKITKFLKLMNDTLDRRLLKKLR